VRQFNKQHLLWLVLNLHLLAGCDNGINSQYKSTVLNSLTGKNNGFTNPEQVNTFLNLYAPAENFPLHLSTKAGEWEGPESVNFYWRGTVIPTTFWSVFDSLVTYDRLSEDHLFFSTKKFWVNSTTLALLTRVPGEYWPSQIYLFLFDAKTNKITQSLRIAEAWADMGDSFYLESSIEKEKENSFRINLNEHECHPVDEKYEQFTCTESQKVYLLQNQEFKLISATDVKKSSIGEVK